MSNSPALDRLLDNLRISLPGAVDSDIARNLFSIYDDFFQWTNFWTQDLKFTTQPNVRDYTVAPTAGVINRLMDVHPPRSEINDGTDPPSTIGARNGYSFPAGMQAPGCISLMLIPNVAQDLIAVVALTVADPLTKDGFPLLPNWMLIKFRDTFEHGVMGRMMLTTGKPWSSADGGKYHTGMYRSGRNMARAEKAHENTYRGQRWAYPQSFNRRWRA